jgi:hypothetical protein
MMKKTITNYDIEKSIRKTWSMNPITRIKPSKKVYSRKNVKFDVE